MRYSLAWASVTAQNVSLKVCVLVLSFVTVVLAIAATRLSFKKPLLIERACFTRAVEVTNSEHTSSEIDIFIREAIRQRFNSDATPIPDYLSSEEVTARQQEQKELGSRNMNQAVVVHGVKISGNIVTVDADRLISVGQIRSALVFPLNVTIATTSRSENNPYGLQVIKVETPKPSEERK